MKTVFAFTTGLLGGILVGVFGTSLIMIESKNLREFTNTIAEEGLN